MVEYKVFLNGKFLGYFQFPESMEVEEVKESLKENRNDNVVVAKVR